MRNAISFCAVALYLAGGIAMPALVARSETAEMQYTAAERAAIYRHSPLGAEPADPTDKVADDPRAARLGQFLFFDKQLSANGKVSCATCHQPTRAFTDGRKIAQGIAPGTRNTPTVLNVVYDQWFFLDGRTDSLWAQALQPFENPREVGTDRLHIAHAIADNPALRKAYEAIFGALPPLTALKRFPAHARPDADRHLLVAIAWAQMAPADRTTINRVYSNLAKAIEAYERKLVNHTSPFDRYVEGLRSHDAGALDAISPVAQRGLKLFVGKANCDLCHSGPTFTDNQFHNLGLPVLPGEAADKGRADGIRQVKTDPFNAMGLFSDNRNGLSADHLTFLPPPKSQLGAFKTPDLRNVARTAPYMHDGRFGTLGQVLDFYSEGKAASHGRLVGMREATVNLVPHLTGIEKSELVAFLKTLNSPPLPAALTAQPAQP